MAFATADQLASFLQASDLSDVTATLVLDMASDAIRVVARDATLDAPTAPAELTRICLQAAARGYQNPQGLRVRARSIDDYTESDTYAAETISASVELTRQERADIRAAVGLSTGSRVLEPSWRVATN